VSPRPETFYRYAGEIAEDLDTPILVSIESAPPACSRDEAQRLETFAPADTLYPTIRLLRAGLRSVHIAGISGDVARDAILLSLARALAETGRRILVVDADADGPPLAEPGRKGLTDVLDLSESIGRLVVSSPGYDGMMAFLPLGTRPGNLEKPGAVDPLIRVLDELRPLYDVILMSAPCLDRRGKVHPAATAAEGVLLVLSAGVVSRDRIRRNFLQLWGVEAPIQGLVTLGVPAVLPQVVTSGRAESAAPNLAVGARTAEDRPLVSPDSLSSVPRSRKGSSRWTQDDEDLPSDGRDEGTDEEPSVVLEEVPSAIDDDRPDTETSILLFDADSPDDAPASDPPRTDPNDRYDIYVEEADVSSLLDLQAEGHLELTDLAAAAAGITPPAGASAPREEAPPSGELPISLADMHDDLDGEQDASLDEDEFGSDEPVGDLVDEGLADGELADGELADDELAFEESLEDVPHGELVDDQSVADGSDVDDPEAGDQGADPLHGAGVYSGRLDAGVFDAIELPRDEEEQAFDEDDEPLPSLDDEELEAISSVEPRRTEAEPAPAFARISPGGEEHDDEVDERKERRTQLLLWAGSGVGLIALVILALSNLVGGDDEPARAARPALSSESSEAESPDLSDEVVITPENVSGTPTDEPLPETRAAGSSELALANDAAADAPSAQERPPDAAPAIGAAVEPSPTTPRELTRDAPREVAPSTAADGTPVMRSERFAGVEPFYAVHITSFRTVDRASSDVRRLARVSGLPADYIDITIESGEKKGLWYRVIVGHFTNPTEAREAAASIRRKGVADYARVYRITG